MPCVLIFVACSDVTYLRLGVQELHERKLSLTGHEAEVSLASCEQQERGECDLVASCEQQERGECDLVAGCEQWKRGESGTHINAQIDILTRLH